MAIVQHASSRRSVELLLTEDVPTLGKQGEMVQVRAGYARNYLLPQGLATVATEHNKRMVEKHRLNLAELEKQLLAQQTKSVDLQKLADGFAEKTFFLRSHYAAWQEFLRRYPRLQIRWRVFLENDMLTPHDLPLFVDPEWPWSAQS